VDFASRAFFTPQRKTAPGAATVALDLGRIVAGIRADRMAGL